MKRLRLIFEFYFTIGVPILYIFNLYTITLSDSIYTPVVLKIIGLFFILIGLYIWILSFFHLGKSFGVLPKTQKKITTGLYKKLHHPMYVGIVFTFLGLSIANQSKTGLLVTLLVTTPVLLLRAYSEDKKLF